MAEVEILREIADAGRDVAAGVVDVKNYHVETPDEVADRIEPILAAGVPAERLALVPDCGFSQTARRPTVAKLARARRRPRPRARPTRRPDQPHREGDPGMNAHHITMLGTGLIGDFYTATLHGQRGRDRVQVVFSTVRGARRGVRRALVDPRAHDRPGGGRSSTPTPTSSSSGCPNYLHEEAVGLAAAAGKAVLCTKPLGRTAEEARRMLETVEKAGVFGGYLEDLCYTPKTLKAIAVGRGRGDRRRDLGPLARDASRPA